MRKGYGSRPTGQSRAGRFISTRFRPIPNLDLDLTSQQSKQAQSLAEVVREWLDSRRAARVTKRALTESEELQIKGLGYAGYD